MGPKVGAARAEVEKGELDMLELHARLARLEELCEQAEAEGRAGELASSAQKKKTEFTLAKVEQYLYLDLYLFLFLFLFVALFVLVFDGFFLCDRLDAWVLFWTVSRYLAAEA